MTDLRVYLEPRDVHSIGMCSLDVVVSAARTETP
jgi:hypothetical protein